MICLTDSEEECGSDNESITSDVNAESVKLKSGLNLKEVEAANGALFEVQQPLEDENGDGEDGDKFLFGEEMFKHCKSELVAIDSEEEEGDEKLLSPFEKMGRHMIDISPDQNRSLLKQIMQPGIEKSVEPNSRVMIHYNAYIEYQSEPYDSTYLRNKKYTFRLGSGESIPGLDFCVSTMSVNEKSYFMMSPDWAYGENGCPPRIPENSTLFFEVVLVNSLDDYAAEEFKKLSIEERNAASFSQIMKVAKAERVSGNNFVNDRRYERASSCYYRAVKLLENATFNNETEESEAKEQLVKLYQNQCLVFDRLRQYRKIEKPALEALKLNPKSSKALFRLGRANNQLCEWDAARRYLLDALRIQPANAAITDELIRLDKRQKDYEAVEKSFCHKIFSGSTKSDESNSDPFPVAGSFAESVSEDFQNLVLDTLEKLKLDDTKTELLLPSFNNVEVACVAACVKVLGGLGIELCPSGAIKIIKM